MAQASSTATVVSGTTPKSSGAYWAAWGTVQKVSNLILNINLYMEDERVGKLRFVKSVDIRGNTDELWRRGLDYMLRNYLFDKLPLISRFIRVADMFRGFYLHMWVPITDLETGKLLR